MTVTIDGGMRVGDSLFVVSPGLQPGVFRYYEGIASERRFVVESGGETVDLLSFTSVSPLQLHYNKVSPLQLHDNKVSTQFIAVLLSGDWTDTGSMG